MSHIVKVQGPRAQGTVVSATLLRELLAIVIDGSRKAVRIRTEGRSSARGGPPPRWIEAATDFTVEIREGSTELVVSSPSLLEANPEEFGQVGLFPEIDPRQTSFDCFVGSLAAAVRGDEGSKLYDRSLLQSFQNLRRVFGSGADSISILNGNTLLVTPGHLERFLALEAKIPPSRQVRVSGKLETIRHSDHAFTLAVAATGQVVRGLAECADPEQLQKLWGRPVLVSGVAHFTAAGTVLRIDAETIAAASERDLLLWAEAPEPLLAHRPVAGLRQPQGPRSGLNAIFGQWPGDETDEEVWRALEEAS